MATALTGISLALASAVESSRPGEPITRLIRDAHYSGILFTWLDDQWYVLDFDSMDCAGVFKRLSVVTLESADPDAACGSGGLNEFAIGCDIDMRSGEWVVDAADLADLRDGYGDELIVLWEQAP